VKGRERRIEKTQGALKSVKSENGIQPKQYLLVQEIKGQTSIRRAKIHKSRGRALRTGTAAKVTCQKVNG